MSKREEVQKTILNLLLDAKYADGSQKWDAPYGVTDGIQNVEGGGKVRTITFGRKRVLDAEILIFRPDHIVVRGEGGIADSVEGTYRSVEELAEVLG